MKIFLYSILSIGLTAGGTTLFLNGDKDNKSSSGKTEKKATFNSAVKVG